MYWLILSLGRNQIMESDHEGESMIGYGVTGYGRRAANNHQNETQSYNDLRMDHLSRLFKLLTYKYIY